MIQAGNFLIGYAPYGVGNPTVFNRVIFLVYSGHPGNPG